MSVAYEEDLANLDQVHRWQRLAAAHRGGDLLPARADAPGGGTEAAIEIPAAIDRSDDRIERHDSQPERTLALEPERCDYLLVRENHANVIGFAAEPADQPRGGGAPAR